MANPFCMGDWVCLSPTGSDAGVQMVRRTEIESVLRRPTWVDGASQWQETVVIGMRSGVTSTVNFRSDTADADAAALVQACLYPSAPAPLVLDALAAEKVADAIDAGINDGFAHEGDLTLLCVKGMLRSAAAVIEVRR